ncbi:hypothetical protein DICSQDRAFT_132309 [Dichomitus squalens LYAD-421 SS1]|uniref:uncharacterized protein n=1 Tax=Dichomitus squalens (strain LYAD-421) TaxID=732165 RepID=UPI0004413D01|nr:uncharacterized protein DICSQDRAFT_132309 [Dichomitus squalens LYAD-421 SS1]EJF66176.1 hypothetical protein DICSQDRAFT_132309 [Dichomitus squalens LYAD-421 SS1]
MKRPLDDDASCTLDVRGAVAVTFKPDQKRRAGDVCKKPSDCTGYIEGKVYDRGTVSDDSWELVLTVELGSRAHVLLSGSISRWFRSLPVAVGAQVRLTLKGVVLEDLPLEKIRPLVLRKRFAWREGVAVYVHNPKTGEEAFFDTWSTVVDTRPGTSFPTTLGTSANPQDAATPAAPKKRRRTPPPTPSTTHEGVPSSPHTRYESPVNECINAVEPPYGEPVGGPSVVIGATPHSSNPNDDSQNPQSLPSPPPELGTDVDPKVDRTRAGEETPVTSLSQAQHGASTMPSIEGAKSLSRPQVVAHQPSKSPVSGVEMGTKQHPNEGSGPSRPKDRRQSPLPGKASKKRWNSVREARRREKQLRKKFGSVAGVQEDNGQLRAGSIGHGDGEMDCEEDYWGAVENDIPEELLRRFDAAELGTGPKDAVRNLDDDPPGQSREPQHEENPSPEAESVPKAEPVPKPEPASQFAPAREPSPPPPSQRHDNADPTEALRIGCHTSFGAYIPLLEFTGSGMRNIMGVIAAAPITTQTKTGEFMMRLNLFDPSNFATSGLNVTLFDKAVLGLPKTEAGDVLILRSIMVDQFNGYCAIGASYKGWQWAVFHVKTGRLSSAPEDSCALRHFQPERSEVHHSLRLGDWWRDASANQVAFGAENPTSASRGRPHKLFSDADCNGYFDCTVEVLHGYQNGDHPYTLFVTDYTRNASVAPIQAAWCPPKLAPVVMQVEMWDSSAQVAVTMRPGEYYSMRNMRLRVSGGGYLEGKMQEGDKIKKLDEDVLENQPHLIELLKRKQEWEARAGTVDGIPEFPHQLIQEVEVDHHFNCTVEVICISAKDDFSYLYVTDYTARPDLVPVAATIASGALAERVVRISLNDAQIEVGKSLETGDFVAIRNLRLRPSNGGTLLSGRLGGQHRLITKLNPKSTSNIELRALLRRKKDYEASQEKPKDNKKNRRASRRAANPPADEGKSRSPSRTKGKGKADDKYVALSDVKASDACPSVFRVRAKVVDFFPDNLRDCTIMRCTNCDRSIPKTRQRCTECDDVMEDTTFVQVFFNLYFSIEDEEGTALPVSVSDERCTVLQDLVPDDVHDDVDDAFSMFIARLQPLLGDLLDVSEGEARRRPNGEGGPMLDLTLGSWLPEGEPDNPDSRAYILLRHVVCDPD